MRLRLFLAGICLFAISGARADSLPVQARLIRSLTPAGKLSEFVLHNPAAKGFAQDFSLSELSLNYQFEDREESATLKQAGQGLRAGGFSARSFVRIGEQGRAFGNAGYTYGKKMNIQWTETSDFELLYPYLTADSVGGDLTSETYRFAGGYAHALGAWTLAAFLDYRAAVEYRKVDPRPHNLVSDLNASLAASRQLGNSDYQLSAGLYGRKYSQDANTITFKDEMRVVPIFHLTGLGMDYIRFQGSHSWSLYNGLGGGGSVELFPASRDGFSASVRYNYFGFDKKLRGLNDLPLNELKEHTVSAGVGYRTEKYGISASGSYRKRTGTENIFGDPGGNMYPQISSNEQYHNKVTHLELSGFVGNGSSARTLWWVEPGVEYLHFEETYPAVNRKMLFSRLQGGADAGVVWQSGSWFWTARLGIHYSANLTGELNIQGMLPDRSRTWMMEDNYRYLTDDLVRGMVTAQANYRISQEYVLSVQLEWGHDRFNSCGTANLYRVTVGFAF